MNHVFFLLMFIIMTTVAVGQSLTTPGSFDDVVCDVYDNPQKYVGKTIKLSAYHEQNINMPAMIWGKKCQRGFIVVSYDDGDKKAYRKLLKNLQTTDQIGKEIGIVFWGELRKNERSGITPIKGVLQDYTFVIKKLIKVIETRKKVDLSAGI